MIRRHCLDDCFVLCRVFDCTGDEGADGEIVDVSGWVISPRLKIHRGSPFIITCCCYLLSRTLLDLLTWLVLTSVLCGGMISSGMVQDDRAPAECPTGRGRD
jgi:hypothetical protein